jgi:hypothetical protein
MLHLQLATNLLFSHKFHKFAQIGTQTGVCAAVETHTIDEKLARIFFK